MADESKTPAQQLLDLVFFAPLGVAATIRDELPKLVERGQQEANLAKMLGQFAVAMGRTEAEKLANRLVDRSPKPTPKPAPTPNPASAPTASPPSPPAAPAPAPPVSVPVADLDALGIPNYDSLSASQVVQRLAGLSPSELNAVEAYEAAHRARRTILNRVGQLRSA